MKQTKIIIITLLFSFLASLIIFNGCGKKEGDVIKIGAILPLSGGASTIGEWHRAGMTLAIDNIKKERKDLNIDMIYEDSRNEGKTGISAIKSLNNKLCNVFISAMSGVSVPLTPIVDSYSKPLFVTSVSFPGFTKLSKNVYRYNVTSDDEAKLMGQYLVEKNIDGLNVIFINDEYGIGAVESLKKTLKGSITKIVFESSYEVNQLDFKSIIDKSKKELPYYIIGYGNSYISLIKSIIERVSNPKIFSVYSMDFPEFRKPLMGNNLKIIYTGPKMDNNNKEFLKFSKDYFDKYGKEPNMVNIFSFDLVRLIVKYWELSPKFDFNEIKGKSLGTSLYGYELIIDENRNINVPLELKTVDLSYEK